MLTAKPRFPIREILLYGWLPSFLKRWVYCLKGYEVGSGAHFSFGSVVCGGKVSIGREFSQGLFSMIRGESIEIGSRVKVGAMSMLDTPHLSIGDDSKINEQVFVGGLQFPHSSLRIGRHSQVQQLSFINPAPSVTIGDDTSIGGHCLIFGHQSWLSVFEGYPADFRPIEIGSNVGVAWRVFIGPGAKIGDGTMIGTHSVVNRTIPSRCLATGSPARVVGQSPYFPRNLTSADRESVFQDIINQLVDYLHGYGMECHRAGGVIEIARTRKSWMAQTLVKEKLWLNTLPEQAQDNADIPGQTRAYLSLRSIPKPLRERLTKARVVWADIESRQRADFGNDLGEELIQFLRRYGVRFYRVSA